MARAVVAALRILPVRALLTRRFLGRSAFAILGTKNPTVVVFLLRVHRASIRTLLVTAFPIIVLPVLAGTIQLKPAFVLTAWNL